MILQIWMNLLPAAKTLSLWLHRGLGGAERVGSETRSAWGRSRCCRALWNSILREPKSIVPVLDSPWYSIFDQEKENRRMPLCTNGHLFSIPHLPLPPKGTFTSKWAANLLFKSQLHCMQAQVITGNSYMPWACYVVREITLLFNSNCQRELIFTANALSHFEKRQQQHSLSAIQV